MHLINTHNMEHIKFRDSQKCVKYIHLADQQDMNCISPIHPLTAWWNTVCHTVCVWDCCSMF